MYYFQTKRLPVYYEGILIYPTVNDILNGAVVDVKFTGRSKTDSFQATSHKIMVLRLGPCHYKSKYTKRAITRVRPRCE